MYTSLLHKVALAARNIFIQYDLASWKNLYQDHHRNLQLSDAEDDYLDINFENEVYETITPMLKNDKFNIYYDQLYSSRQHYESDQSLFAYIQPVGGTFNLLRKHHLLQANPTFSIVLAKPRKSDAYKFSDIFAALIMNYASGDILLTEEDQITILIENSIYVKDYVRTNPASQDNFLLLANLSDYKTRSLLGNMEEGLFSNDQWSVQSYNNTVYELSCVLTGDADAYIDNVCLSTELAAAYLMMKNSGGEILQINGINGRENLYYEKWLSEDTEEAFSYSIVAAGTNQGANRIADMIDPPKKKKK